MLLRAGCKLHLQKYVRLPDDVTDPPTRLVLQPLLDRVSALPPVTKFLVAGATYRAFSSGEEAEEQAAAAAAAADAKQDARGGGGGGPGGGGGVKQEASDGDADMRDASSDGEGGGGGVKKEEAEPAVLSPSAPKADPNAPPKLRPPCMWMLLTPVREPGAPEPPQGAPRGDLALPIHIDGDLPDFLMPAATYEERVAKQWAPGERFRMYFGGKHGQKVRGSRAGGRKGAAALPYAAAACPGRAPRRAPAPPAGPAASATSRHPPPRPRHPASYPPPPHDSPPGRRRLLQGHHHVGRDARQPPRPRRVRPLGEHHGALGQRGELRQQGEAGRRVGAGRGVRWNGAAALLPISPSPSPRPPSRCRPPLLPSSPPPLKVCPWEVEEDPDEVRRQADLRRKEEAAAAAAEAARRKEEAAALAAASAFGRRAAAAVGSYYEGDGSDGEGGRGRGASSGAGRRGAAPGGGRGGGGGGGEDDEFEYEGDDSDDEEDGAMKRRRKREEEADSDFDLDEVGGWGGVAGKGVKWVGRCRGPCLVAGARV
jgi:hypothetical protein